MYSEKATIFCAKSSPYFCLALHRTKVRWTLRVFALIEFVLKLNFWKEPPTISLLCALLIWFIVLFCILIRLKKQSVTKNCSDLSLLEKKWSRKFSQSLEHSFLTVGQNNFGNKIPSTYIFLFVIPFLGVCN